MNRFLYAEGNPWTFIDPSGHAACASASSDLCDETTAIQHKNTQAGKNAAKRVSGRDWDYYWRQRALKSTGPSRGYDSDPQATPEWASGDDWGEGTSIGQASASQTAAQAAATTCTRTRWGQSCQSAQQQADSAATLAGIGDTLSAFGNGLLQMGTCVGSGGTSCDARMLIGLGQMASNPGGTVATIAADRWSAIQSGDKRTGAAAVSATILDVFGLALAPVGGEAADVADVADAAAEGSALTQSLRIYASQGRVDAAERAGVLSPGSSGNLFATNGQYEFGNVAQSNLAISAHGENVAGYWEVPAEYATKFTYVGRVQPTEIWDGGGPEFTWSGSMPFEALGRFQRIPWAAAH